MNTLASQLEVAIEVGGLALGGLSGLRELAFGSAAAVVASTLLHGRPSVILNHRIGYLNLEIEHRKLQAISLQDIGTLDILDPVKSRLT